MDNRRPAPPRSASVGCQQEFLYALENGVVTPGTYPERGFHSLVAGATGRYSALFGSDYATGLDTFWSNEIYADLK